MGWEDFFLSLLRGNIGPARSSSIFHSPFTVLPSLSSCATWMKQGWTDRLLRIAP